MITTDKTTDSGSASTTTTTNTSGSYTFNSMLHYCEKRLPCGRCALTGKECDEKPGINIPYYPPYRPYWWEPYWTCGTYGPIGSDSNTVPTVYLNNTKKE